MHATTPWQSNRFVSYRIVLYCLLQFFELFFIRRVAKRKVLPDARAVKTGNDDTFPIEAGNNKNIYTAIREYDTNYSPLGGICTCDIYI